MHIQVIKNRLIGFEIFLNVIGMSCDITWPHQVSKVKVPAFGELFERD